MILKFPRVRLVPREFVESLAGTLGFAWFTYCSSFHFVADALMALNRFRAISSTTEMPKVCLVEAHVLNSEVPIPVLLVPQVFVKQGIKIPVYSNFLQILVKSPYAYFVKQA